MSSPSPLLSLAIALALLTLGFDAHASAYCRMTTSTTSPTPEEPCPTDGVPLAWTRPCISYAIDERGIDASLVSDLRTSAEVAFGTWEAVDCGGETTGLMTMQISEPSLCDDAGYNKSGGNVNTIAVVDDWIERDYSPTAFAVTTVWHSIESGEILDADILVNRAQGPYARCPDSGCPFDADAGVRVVDIHGLLTHETGHVYGISHSSDPNATMFATAIRGTLRLRELGSDDQEAICAVYPPGSLDDVCDFTPRGGLDLECSYANPSSSGGGGRCDVALGSPPSPLPWLLLFALVPMTVARRRRGVG